MDSATALTNLAYVVTAYMMAYLLYLMLKDAENSSILGLPARPYDGHHLVLKRRII
jgi:hypothetical protein